jgi:predicted HTH transcriptional regulator
MELNSNQTIDLQVNQGNTKGKQVLKIKVFPCKKRPHCAETSDRKFMFYIRSANENILANSILLKSWILKRNKQGLLFRYDVPLKKRILFLENERVITLSKFSKVALINRDMAKNILAESLVMSVIEINDKKESISDSRNDIFDRNKQ